MADIQDINVATRNLYQLLDVMAEVVMNTPADKQGMVARAQALTSIARDEAERIDAAVESLVDGGLSEDNSEAKAIDALGRQYNAAREAWIKADMAADKSGDEALTDAAKTAEALHDKYRDELFAFRPKTQAGFAELRCSSAYGTWPRAWMIVGSSSSSKQMGGQE